MKKLYHQMNEHIYPNDALNTRVMEKIGQKCRPCFRSLGAVAAILALLLVATPVMANYVPAISELMYQVSPEMAARFMPVQKTDTANGIRMEVISASIHGATAEVCISFEDLTADRIDERLRTQDAELLGKNLFLSGSWGGSISNFDFNPETGKAIMVINQNYSFYSQHKDRYLTVDELFNGKITVYVESLYWYTDDGGTESIPGPWRVTFKIDESNYIGEHDDGSPATTYPASE